MGRLLYPLLSLICLLHLWTEALHAQNGTVVEIACRPAEIFIRTHMAPDFISPQLVRRLDWYHDDTLVASFQQGQMEDSSREWWVTEEALSFGHPFYTLKIKELRPEHSGSYKCRLETDPLFSLDLSTSTVELNVMVTPVAPHQPEIRGITNSSVTLSWNHPTARAHRPILRYAVLVRGLMDGSRFVIPALSNATSVIVDNLSPHSRYAFSVRAENIAGESAFGPEIIVTTKGIPPLFQTEMETHTSTDSCIKMLMKPPEQKYGELLFYRVEISVLNSNETTEKNITSPSSSLPPSVLSPLSTPEWIDICDLLPSTFYSLSIQSALSHGLSPPKKIVIQTEEGVPSAPPPPSLHVDLGHSLIRVHWRKPIETRGKLVHYSIHYRRMDSSEKWSTSVHSVTEEHQKGRGFHATITGLRPNTRYSFRVSASTSKGEGEKSGESYATTDVNIPSTREISNVSIECAPLRVKIGWNHVEKSDPDLIFTLTVRNKTDIELFNTTQEHIILSHLLHKSRYIVHLTTLQRSKINKTVLLASNHSIPHEFMINDGCMIMSSICSTDSRCLPLTSVPTSGRFAFIFILILVLLFLIFSCFIAYLLKRKCLDLKKLMHKKQREKNVLVEELSPLVYDTEGMEEVPVELFYGMCEDLSRNNNLKYSMLFDRINELTETETDGGTPSEGGEPMRDRYANITATETSRVRIQESEGGSDYINANYVDSCDSPHAYIATQAPLPSTFGHFWSMVWQERINVVVVITNLVEDGKRKCDQYWPSATNQPQQYGNYQVSLLSQSTNAHFVHRILSLKIAKSVPPTDRRIHHIHFSSWPDHGVPSSVFPLLSFLHFIADIHSTGPVLVHCSAGVGRSGSFILIDSMRKRLLNSRSLNMAAHLVHIRRQREKTVQTIEQFIFCHEVVRQMARHGITRVPANIFPRYVQFLVEESFNGKMRLQSQFDDICRCNHESRCTPYTNKLVILPGFHRLDEFIISFYLRECPDLWRTVWEYGCESIVIIHPEMEENLFWTRLDEQIDDITITYEDDNKVNLSSKDEELSVNLLHLSERAMDSSTWSELERIQSSRVCSSSSPLFVISSCPIRTSSLPPSSLISNGKITTAELSSSLSICRPFLFCALTSLACQLEQHSVLDVIQILDAFHRKKCSSFPNRQSLEFLYERLLLLVNLNRQS